MSAIYNTLKRLIDADREGMKDKVNNMYAYGQISDDEYMALMKQLQPQKV